MEVKMRRNANKYAPCGANFEKVHGANPWRGEEMKKRGAPRRVLYKYPTNRR